MHFKFLQKRFFPLPILLTFLVLSACQATLAPAYDQAIVQKVTESSDLAMRFFAEVEGGTQTTDYPVRENTYNTLIGAFESLKIQTRARPMPDNKALEKINGMLQTKGSEGISDPYPSAFAFERIAETFRKMKKYDKEGDVNADVITSLKARVEIYLDQAMTYESFLKR